MKKSLKQKIKQLEQEEEKIRANINKIEEEEIRTKQLPRLKSMVGQCFAYRKNCYSCPKKPSDYWDVFRRIIDWVESKERGFFFICEEFSIDAQGIIRLEINNFSPCLNKKWWDTKVPFSGFVKITEREYNVKKIEMLEEMNSQVKMRKILNSKWDW